MKQQHTLIALIIAAQSSMLVGPRLVANAQGTAPTAGQQQGGIGILPGNPPAPNAAPTPAPSAGSAPAGIAILPGNPPAPGTASAPAPNGANPLGGLPIGADAASLMAGKGNTSALATAASGSGTGAANANADDAAPLLTIVDAISAALQDNPQIGAARAGLNAAQARIGQAKALGGLQVGVNGSGAYNNYYDVNLGAGSPPSEAGAISSLTGLGYSETGNLTATYPIYTGGRVKASTRVAQANARAQAAQVLQTEQDIVLETTQAYLNTLRARQLLDVAESNLAVNQESYRVAKVRFDAGDVARLDVLQAETNLATAQQNQVSANNAVGESKANLNTLLGRNPETPVRLELVTTLTPRIPLTIQPGAEATGGVIPPNGTLPNTGGVGPSIGPSVPPAGQTSVGTSPGSPGTPPVYGSTPPGQLAQPLYPPGLSSPGTVAPPPATTGAGQTVPLTGNPGSATGGTTSTTTPTTPATPLTSPPAPPTVATPNVNGTGTPFGVTTPGAYGAGSSLNPLTGSAQTTYATGPLTTPVNTNLAAESAALQATAGTTRQSLAVTQAQLEAAEANVDVAKSQRRPSIGSSIAGILRNPATALGQYALSIGLTIAQTLYDSGEAKDQIIEAKALVEQLKATLIGQRQSVANTIEQSLFALDTAQRNLSTSDVAVDSAAEALRAAQLGYSAGANTQLDVSNAQTALLTAQTNAVNARFDVATAQADLAADVGVLTAEGQAGYAKAYRAEVQRIELQQQEDKHHKKHAG